MRIPSRLMTAAWVVALLAPHAHSLAATWEIRPSCAPGAVRCLTHPQKLTQWQGVAPGDEVLIYPSGDGAGWVSQLGGATVLHIENAKGRLEAPIVVRGMEGARLAHGANITRSAHVILRDLEISEQRRWADGSGRPALTIQGGTHHLKVMANRLHQATGSGIQVASDAGPFVSLGPGNRVLNNAQHGVAVTAHGLDPDAPAPAVTSDVSGNLIQSNGLHGVDVSASFWRVARNTVRGNGWAQGGTSGIHLFSRIDRGEGVDCDGNEVIYNAVSFQIDRTAYDGNGIQIDHFCDRNVLAFNVVRNNDGAGVSVVAGKGNFVVHNTLYHNAQDQSRINTPALRAELIVASWTDFCWNPYIDAASCRLPVGRASDNLFIGNLLEASQPDVPVMWVNDDAADPARNVNKFGPNMYGHAAGGPVLRWASKDVRDAQGVDLLTQGSPAAGVALVERASFVDIANPSAPRHGLRLSAWPSRAGMGPLSRLPDAAGVSPQPGMAAWGAYYLSP